MIDYAGQFYARGVCTDKGSTAAIGFPIDSVSAAEAESFARTSILKLLPGWERGVVEMRASGKFIKSFILRRGES